MNESNSLANISLPNGDMQSQSFPIILKKAFESNEQEIQISKENDSETIQGYLKLAEISKETPETADFCEKLAEKMDAVNQRRHEDVRNNRLVGGIIIVIAIVVAGFGTFGAHKH